MNPNQTDLGLSSRCVTTRGRHLGRTVSLAVLALGLLGAPGCKKNKETTAPGGGSSKEDVAQAIANAKQEAKVAGLIDLANADLANGRYVSAIKRAEEALQANPDNADGHAIMGAALWRAGDFDGSSLAYEKSLELDPTNFGGSLGLARNLQAIGGHARAIELADRLLAEDKDQIDPWLTRLWSHYATADAKNAIVALDELFSRLPADDPQLGLIQSYAAFMRPFEDKGQLCAVKGKSGTSDANIDHNIGMKYTGAVIGDEFARVILFENNEEAIIDKALAKTLKLKELGKVKPLGQTEEVGVVLVPSVKFGDLSVENVPARVQDLSPYEEAMGERPGLILGRQCMHALGTIEYDFPNHKLTVAKDAPSAATAQQVELPLLLISMHVVNAPAVPIRINGSEHEFFVYFGGIYRSGVAVTKKHYFKSGRLPREVDPPDDEDAGLKMVYVDEVNLGEKTLPGMGGLVLLNTPPDSTLGTLVENTAFELGGYVNMAVIEGWKVTYSLSEGKVYIEPSRTKGSTKTASAQ
jgi:tetratricopeptide (TPR) repeat protein